MVKSPKLEFDTIGYWSEIKLDIVKKYATKYTTILSAERQQRLKFYYVYIDAFAGPGLSISRKTGEFVLGSPLNALEVEPPFKEFHFIDIDGTRISVLKELVGDRPEVHFYPGDCNNILLEQVFPRVSYKDYRRGLCLLDPYGLQLNWEVIETAGQMNTIDMFLNFPVMDMNRNALWRNPEKVTKDRIARMNAYWGDESWRNIAYKVRPTLFGWDVEKAGNEAIAEAFRERLVNVANFKRVPPPLPMRNRRGAIVYYLFFAAQKIVSENIIESIFRKYQNRGAR